MDKKKLLEKFTHFVDTLDDGDDEKENKSSKSVNEALQDLFPSSNGRAGGKKSKTSPPASLPSRGKRFKQRGKEKAPKKRRGSEMKKDIFLLPHPVYQRIPLKSARTNYHKKKLVITGLTINDEMTESQIKTLILERFQTRFANLQGFEFLKAVNGDDLVQPDVDEYDFHTIKHFAKTTPIYIRSSTDLGLDNVDPVPLRDLVDELNSPFDVEASDGSSSDQEGDSRAKKDNAKINQQPSSSNSRPRSSIERSYVDCPICGTPFPANFVEKHAADCGLINYSTISVSEDEEIDETLPYEEESEEVIQNVGDLIRKFSDTDPFEKLSVRRLFAWKDYRDAMVNKPWFTGKKALRVRFVGEPGTGSGPVREFFTVAIDQMKAELFTDGLPNKSTMNLTNQSFFYAGRLMGSSVLHCGMNPAILQDWCYNYILTSSMPTVTDYPEEFTRKPDIQKLLEAKSNQEIRDTLIKDDAVYNLVEKIGFTASIAKFELSQREDVLRCVYFKEEIEPRLLPLSQLSQGLDINGLLKLLQKNPGSFKGCFTCCSIKDCDITDLTRTIFNGPIGSNLRAREINVQKIFDDVMDRLSNGGIDISKYCSQKGNLEFSDLLLFITGTPTVPAGGFDSNILIRFKPEEECGEDCKCLPVSSLCEPSITLPMHNSSFEAMTKSIVSAIKDSNGIGKV